MAIAAFSPEWAQAFKEEINRSPVYQQAGKGWKWTVGLVVDAEPDKNFPEARGVVLDLFEGQAREVHVGSAAEAQACDFVISGSYTRWKEVATKKLDATRGMLQGKLKLNGDLLVLNGLAADRDLTIRADADTVMGLSSVPIGFAGMPNYLDPAGREVVRRMLSGRLKIQGVLGNLTTLNQVTRLFSVAE